MTPLIAQEIRGNGATLLRPIQDDDAIDLAPLVGADLSVMDRDARRMRGARPFIFTNLKENRGVAEIANFILEQGGIARRGLAA